MIARITNSKIVTALFNFECRITGHDYGHREFYLSDGRVMIERTCYNCGHNIIDCA